MTTDLHTMSGAYAIDALSDEEAAEFRKHLADCPACRDEVVELREAASLMGASEAVSVPPLLKARVMAAIDKEPQLPPRARATASAPAELAAPRSITSAPSRRWAPRLLSAAAAIVLVVGVAFGISQTQNAENAGLVSAAQVFEASDAKTATVDATNGGKLSVATSSDLGKMAVDTEGLKKLGSKQVYQIWAIEDGSVTSEGIVEDLEAGAAMDLPEQGTKVAITIEPAGGSEKPTTQPIVQVDPSSV